MVQSNICCGHWVPAQRLSGGANSARFCQVLHPASAGPRIDTAMIAIRLAIMTSYVGSNRLMNRVAPSRSSPTLGIPVLLLQLLLLAACGGTDLTKPGVAPKVASSRLPDFAGEDRAPHPRASGLT